MPKRLTQLEVDFRYATAGVEALSPYTNGHTPTSSRCLKCGHIWDARLDHLYNGHGCPKCANYLPLTQEEVQQRFLQRGLELVSTYTHSHIKVEARCLKCLRTLSVEPTNVFHGDMGCRFCKLTEVVDYRIGETRRFTQSEVAVKFLESRLELLGEYVNSATAVKARCMNCFHEYHPIPSVVINRGSGCPKCGHVKKGEKRRLSDSEVFSRMEFLEIRLLEPYQGSNKSIMVHHLKCGHEFKRIPSDIFAGKGCPQCCGTMLLTHSSAAARMLELGIELLEPYLNARSKILVRSLICKHEWRSTPNKIFMKRGCPKCAKYGFQLDKPAILYYIRINTTYGHCVYKTGITNRTVKARFGNQMSKIVILKIRYFRTGEEAYVEEQRILLKHVENRYLGPPLLSYTGIHEMFSCDVLGLDKKEGEVLPLLL